MHRCNCAPDVFSISGRGTVATGRVSWLVISSLVIHTILPG